MIAFFADKDDDVVLLQLVEGNTPLGPERMPVLGIAKKSQGNAFRSYGYRRLEDYIAGWADGKIQGHVEPPPKRKVQEEPVQLESNQINRGMSGSAVLDVDRNLVIGIVSETWFPDRTGKDRDTGWAVDSRVLSLEPLGLDVQDAPLALKPGPEPKTDEQTKQQVVQIAQVTVEQRAIEEKYSWNNAPAVLMEWIGRDDLLNQITADWNNPQKHVTGLIGFGGEGKSSLARKWVDILLNEPSQPQPEGVFWWGFYENRSVDEFLEAALKYMSGGRIDPRQVQSSNLRAQIIGAMLGTGRYLFVLDGLEVMQHQEGDQYGLLQSNDLRDLLTFFARPDNLSFCLITSRAPLLDLMEYTTYTHHDVDSLLPIDGRLLLRRLGVQGNDAELDRVVADWDSHALTLSLLGSYLSEYFRGKISHLADIPAPTADEPSYERVHRVLRRYDEHLNNNERELLKLFSAFRTPVHEDALEKVFVLLFPTHYSLQDEPIGTTETGDIYAVVSRLTAYRILRHDVASRTYTAHPLVRNHYLSILRHDTGAPNIHDKIKGYYISIAAEKPVSKIKDFYLPIASKSSNAPSFDSLRPLIEAVHHSCQAGAYGEAFRIFDGGIYRGDDRTLVDQLGAWETAYDLMLEFFPAGDIWNEPLVTDPDQKTIILREIGICLVNLGHLSKAAPFLERFVKRNIEAEDLGTAIIVN